MPSERAIAPSGLETKFLAIDPDAVREGARIEGYASVFDRPDDSGDEVAPGAFAASLARKGLGVKLLWQHDPAQPIGVWETLAEDERGLYARGRLLTELRQGAEAAALLRAGAIDGLSIGYRTLRAVKAPNGGRRLVEIDLWEVSLVTFPMLPEARAVATGPEARADAEARALADALREARGLLG
ncbi:MAG: HK97 family phage prohead protease [Rubrimonas sp.]|uniref:HK97 family phage prohead protease n=1 Tax=Rubrimonas sp. TaxID=2036015 RepID=UPI002FDCDD4D